MSDVNANAFEGKVIVLKSVYSKDRKLVAMPVYDPKTRWYLGIPRLSDEDKKGLNFWTEPTSKLTIRHNDTFDLNDPTDKANWEWVKHLAAVAMSFDECQKSKEALFYVDNEDIEAQKVLAIDDLILEALTYVKNDRDDMLANRARILGFDMEGDSPLVIRKLLNKMSKDANTVRRVIQAYTSNSVAIQLLFLKARDKAVIKAVNGAFMYGETVLGVTDESVVAYLQDPVNRALVELIEKDVNGNKAEKPKAGNKAAKPKAGTKDENPEPDKEE